MAHIHLKRLAIPKTWPLARKKNTFIARLRPGSHVKEHSMPLTVIFREMLSVAETSKEVKYILRKNKVFVGGKRRNDHQYPVGLLEVISFQDHKEHYRLVLNNLGKLACISIEEKDAKVHLGKIQGKCQVPGGKFQYNLSGGRNILMDKQHKDYKIGDTLVLDDKNKVTSHLPLKKGALVYFVGGQLQGTTATVEAIQDGEIIVTNKEGTSKTLAEYAHVVGDKAPVIKLA